MVSKAPARIDLSLDGEQFAPGATVTFNVNVTARDRTAGDLVAELVGVEEVHPFPEGDEDAYGEYEDEIDEEDVDPAGLVAVSTNGDGNGEVDEDEDEDEDGDEEWVQSSTFSEELVLAEGLNLKSGESRSFSGSFVIPEDAQPTYDGINATHTWWVDIYLEGDIEITESKEFTVR